MELVIVESPTKAKTIQKFLGREYKVMSSFGHVRDLPTGKIGIDIENDFKPDYIIVPKAKKNVGLLKKEAEKADEIILATDEDREGEAIAWHIAQILNLGEFAKKKSAKNYKRIVFHEITKNAIEHALGNSRKIDMDLVDSQQARRVLDRLVGYKLSPLLWRKIRYGLSAGRVQSVAVRLIVEREEEINKFKPEEYWTIEANLSKKERPDSIFKAKLIKEGGKAIPKLGIKTKEESERIKNELKNLAYRVSSISKKETRKNPLPPFTTSTLQQAANNRLGYSAKQTMMIAQQLYEGVELGSGGPTGLITYMRTDSLNLSNESVLAAEKYIRENFGDDYFEKRYFKTKSKGAQEAHEAIRPANPSLSPESIKEYLNPKQFKIYNLVWQRMIASQMSGAVYDQTSIDIDAGGKYVLRANGSVLKFAGFLKVYPIKSEDTILPVINDNEALDLIDILNEQHFTEPPARYNEASLIKTLEQLGIGRPSTYAPTISTIQERGYVEKIEKRFHPKEIGVVVNKLLVENFPQIVDVQFTAKMEAELDDIEENKKEWVPVISEFYKPFEKNLEEKEKTIDKRKLTEEKSDEKCEKCGSPMVIKLGRFGKFLACTNYPKCKTTKPFGDEKALQDEFSNEKCEKCGKPMKVKRGKFGAFLGCSGYPECKNIKPIVKSTGIKCPQCRKNDIVEKKSKRGRVFYACSGYPECKFALWSKPTGELCPKCNSLMVYGKNNSVNCSNKECAPKKE